jgi:hypothetical protein
MTHETVGVAEARRRFGGIDVAASLAGMLVALALVVVLGGVIAAAIGAYGYQVGLEGNERELSIAGLAGGIVTLFLAFLFGGWAAGRMARYDGGKNGLMSAVWALILAAILAGLGAWLGEEYDVFRNRGLPQWFSDEAMTVGAIASGAIALLAMLLGGYLGGRWGERLHRRADATIAAVEGESASTTEYRDSDVPPAPGSDTVVQEPPPETRSPRMSGDRVGP